MHSRGEVLQAGMHPLPIWESSGDVRLSRQSDILSAAAEVAEAPAMTAILASGEPSF